MIIIGNDIVIDLKDYIKSLLNEHFYGFRMDVSLEEMANEIRYFMIKLEKIGIDTISVKTTKSNNVEIIFKANNNKYRLLY